MGDLALRGLGVSGALGFLGVLMMVGATGSMGVAEGYASTVGLE
jgi:hypothetical protein